ncbi:MAG: hypothetical protein F9K40_02085 [Kofleriaceae bacterium]|nr:MAG: hypothetical protein F9K40_02085 [Kofleriaceae bacterium]MBZ0233966.1 hypothetical protein [Kofleriaceae bacterium]
MWKPDTFKEFLTRPVPPSGTKQWSAWQLECREFGPDAVDVALDALENGSENEQYVAVLALRLFGYEADAEGYDEELVYRVRAPDEQESRMITPILNPTPYTP